MANDIIDIIVTDNSDNVQLNVTPNLVSINVSNTSGNIIGSNYYLSSTYGALPVTGDITTLYVINDTSLMYRWSGSAYVQINSSAVVAWGQITGSLASQTDLQTALNLKAPIASPTFTGTVSGITKSMVGLGNVDNTTDLLKPISTATQSALNLKYDASNPAGYTTNVGTVTSVGGTGTVSGLSLSGSVTTSGNLTLGGTLSLTSGNVTTALGYTPENTANKGIANGYASLDGGGLVPSTQLPSYVDDVLEYANLAGFPASGTTGKIYVDLDTNKIYRWSGSTYIEVSPTVGTIWGGITGTLSNQTDLQNALNLKYNTPTGDTTQYVAGDGSLIAFPVAGQSGTIVRLVRNNTGATLTKGTVIYISGATGNNPVVSKAIATGDATSAQTFGLCQTNIANNATGYVVVMGDLIGLDTSAFTEGQQVYLSGTVAGAFTATKQYAPIHLVYIGIITRSHPTLGQIEVKIQNGYELDEIHDVSAQNPANNDIIAFNTTSGLWEKKSIATTLGFTPSNDSLVVHLAGTETITGQKTFNPTVTAASAIARGTNLTPTLIASANSDVLVGLDINPTFTNGAFTGVINGGLRVSTILAPVSSNIISFFSSVVSTRGIVFDTSQSTIKGNDVLRLDYTSNFLDFRYNPSGTPTTFGRFFTSGNLTLQNGGTFTDAGYRLDVAGTTRFQGTTASDTAPLGSELAAVTGTGTNWTLAGTNLNVGGYTHTVGSTTALTTSLAAVSGTYYQITYTITGRTTGSITIAYGGTSTAGITASGNTGPLASSTAVLTITPTTDFNGTVVLSIKSIGTSSASSTFANSSGTSNIEVRASSIVGNTFIGIDAGRRNTTGNQNAFLGYFAGANNTTGYNNTFFGYNTAVKNTTGNQNTIFGTSSFLNNTTGVSNNVLGYNALVNNTTGNSNFAFGQNSMQNNTTGSSNISLGNYSLGANLTGNQNISIGIQSLQEASAANNTIAIGFDSGRYFGGSTSNIVTTINNSIFIGTGTKALGNSQTNQIVIGDAVTGLGSNTTVLGNGSTVTTAIYGNLVLGSTTDAGFKLDVTGTARVSGLLTGTTASFSGNGNFGSQPLQSWGSIFKAIQVGASGSIVAATSATETDIALYSNTYYDGTSYKILNSTTQVPSFFQLGDGTLTLYTGNTGTVGSNVTGLTAKFTVTKTGNVGIGTSSPADSIIGSGAFLDIASTGGGALKLHFTNATAAGEFSFYKGSNGSYIDSAGAATSANNDLIFRTSGTASNYGVSERMRITSDGSIAIGTTTRANVWGLLTLRNTLNAVGSKWGIGPDTNNSLTVFNPSNVGVYIVDGATSWTANSDINLKDIQEYIENAIDSIMGLKAIKFNWKSDVSKNTNIGLIAQEVQKVYPELIDKNSEGYLGVRYTELIPVLVKAIQELSAEITLLKNK